MERAEGRETRYRIMVGRLTGGQVVVDRAGFEPAAFRFFFRLMRTGRSLAPILLFRWVYQAELPALGPLEILARF